MITQATFQVVFLLKKKVVCVSKKFTDKQIKSIIADYAECENYTKVAKKYKTSRTTITRIVNSDPDMGEKVRIKKEENAQTVLSHMESRTEDVCLIIDELLNALKDKEKLKKANILQIATAFGIVVDKFADISTTDDNGKIEDLIKGLKNGK